MNEASFNHDIGKSLEWSYKIPDDGSSIGIGGKRPFDGFGIVNGKPVYWESKFLKSVSAFNFDNLKQHQIDNLFAIKKLAPDSYCLFIVGVQYSTRETRAYIFHDIEEIFKRKRDSKSIFAKEFEQLTNYITRKSGSYDIGGYLNGIL